MASEANDLRKLASLLRAEAEVREAQKTEKIAQVLVAAVGLDKLRTKVKTNV
jgi:hypothetical protein